jgi:glycosyltransferase involved in cell wall biosynthesis
MEFTGPERQSPAQIAGAPRVAVFSDAFPERNGTGAYYHDLLQQLAPRVAALEMFQPCQDGAVPRFSIPMPGDADQRLAAPPWRSIRSACDRLRPDVVVVVTPGLYGLLGVWEARRRGALLISAFHTDFEALARMYWNPVSRFVVNMVLRTANRIVCSRAERVLINNENLATDVKRLGARSVEVIGTPLAPDFVNRAVVPISGELKRVCFAGRLAPEKNVHEILRAALALPQLEFVIGGDGPLRRQLEEQAAGHANVRFAGWLSRQALISMIDEADLLLLPSAFETFGSVALEAMARGRPAVVTTSAGISAWPQLNAGLITIPSPDSLGGALAELCGKEPAFWQARSRAAREAALALNEETLVHWLSILNRGLPAPQQAG